MLTGETHVGLGAKHTELRSGARNDDRFMLRAHVRGTVVVFCSAAKSQVLRAEVMCMMRTKCVYSHVRWVFVCACVCICAHNLYIINFVSDSQLCVFMLRSAYETRVMSVFE